MEHFQERKTFALFSNFANKKIIAELRKKQHNLFLFPKPDIDINELDARDSELLGEITIFDWIVFPDVFAVDYFLQTLEETGKDIFELDLVKVCAFGESVSDRLRFSQLHADVVATEINDEAIFSALENYLYNQNFESQKFLFVKALGKKYSLEEKLIENKARVLQLPVYRISENKNEEILKLKTLLLGGAADEFIFSEAEDFFALQFLLNKMPLSAALRETKISVTNENVFLTAKEFGLRPLYFQMS